MRQKLHSALYFAPIWQLIIFLGRNLELSFALFRIFNLKIFSFLRVAVPFSPRAGAFHKVIIGNLLKSQTLSALVRAAPLNADQGSTGALLSTLSSLLSDHKSLDCVSSVISARNTLFSSRRLVWR